MAYQNAYFHTAHKNPDYEALKAQLGSLDGVNAMEIDQQAHGVMVVYDNSYLPYNWLQQRMGTIGYLPQEYQGL